MRPLLALAAVLVATPAWAGLPVAYDIAYTEQRRIPWFLWPFYAIWRLLTVILNATGRLVLAVLGIALMVVGLTISLTVIGAPVGLPLAILGLLLLLRAFF